MEQSRGVARQLNDAIGAARALLKSSFTDSRLDLDVPLARHAISSIGALGFRIGDLSNPKPATPGDTEVDLTSFAALTTQVDAPAMSDMLNTALTTGPVSLPDAVAMLDTAYLGHVIVLWSWALKQPNPEATESANRALPLPRRPRPRNRRPPFDIHRTHHHPGRSQHVTTEADIDFSSLPQVDQSARPPVQRRPRFDGDVSDLPDRACWALEHLLTRRYISAEADADVYSWVLEYRKELSVRLAELDLLLRIVDGTDVAFVEQARYESARGIKLLRREPLGTYDSILALHLAQMMRANANTPVFAQLMLDEAFSKSDPQFAQQALQAFRKFGFQLVIVATVQNATTIQPYIDSVVMVSKTDPTGRNARPVASVATRTISEFTTLRNEMRASAKDRVPAGV
jgi:hypothetical protein